MPRWNEVATATRRVTTPTCDTISPPGQPSIRGGVHIHVHLHIYVYAPLQGNHPSVQTSTTRQGLPVGGARSQDKKPSDLPPRPKTITIATYNLYNMFDVYDDPYSADEGTRVKPRAEIENVAQTL